MERTKHLDFIRSKAVEANPEIIDYDRGFFTKGKGWQHDWMDDNGINRRSVFFKTQEAAQKGSILLRKRPIRPIRLADVLLTVGAPETKVTLTEINKRRTYVDIIVQWNLKKDDLNEQSNETLLFLYNLLS